MENQSTKTIVTKIALLGMALGIGVFVLIWLWSHPQDKSIKAIGIGDTRYNQVEVSDSAEERSRGLSHRETFCQACAMLFVFDVPGQYGFWMKDMRFRIDILWVRDGKVVHKESNVAPDNQAVMRPEGVADWVIELLPNQDIKVGDRVQIIY